MLVDQNGFDVRLAADVFTKWIYPDVYAWLQLECDLRAWLGIPLPEADDPRIVQFAEQNTNATGEIETTRHVALVLQPHFGCKAALSEHTGSRAFAKYRGLQVQRRDPDAQHASEWEMRL